MSGKPSRASDSSPVRRKSAVKPPKKELSIDSPPADQLASLKSAAKISGADLTQIICRDEFGRLISVAVYARDPYAARLERWLKRLDKEEAS